MDAMRKKNDASHVFMGDSTLGKKNPPPVQIMKVKKAHDWENLGQTPKHARFETPMRAANSKLQDSATNKRSVSRISNGIDPATTPI